MSFEEEMYLGAHDPCERGDFYPEKAKPVILLVDDDPDQLLLFTTILSSDGFDVITANGAQEALAMLSETQVDCVVSDFMMPEMDGSVFVQCVRESSMLEHMPVVLLTAASADVEMSLIGAGADIFCSKDRGRKQLSKQIRLLLT
jgi:CheY-like chemotaxis protein